MRSQQSSAFLRAALIGQLLLMAGCVTQTEQVSRYEQEKEESAWDELRREFGWQSKSPPLPPGQEAEPFYRRAARSVKETVSGWFADDDPPFSQQGLGGTFHRIEQQRPTGLPRLRMQQSDGQEEEHSE